MNESGRRFAEFLGKLDRAALAQLRRVPLEAAHADARVLRYLGGWADDPSAPAAMRTPAVVAVLYARHRRHEFGVPVGEAIRRLGRDGALDRRFERLVRADFATLVGELAQILTRLANEEIPLDYGRLHQDLETIERRERLGQVNLPDPRAAWAGSYYRYGKAEETEEIGERTTKESSNEEEERV